MAYNQLVDLVRRARLTASQIHEARKQILGPAPGKVIAMVSDELMQKVMSLDLEDRRQVFFALLYDPELKINPFDAINLRQNEELAFAMQEMLRKEEAEQEAASE